MYDFFNGITNSFTVPLSTFANSFMEFTLLYALLLGIVGSMGNIGAITLFGNKSLQSKVAWSDVLFFTLGKAVAFSCLGLLVWFLGREFQSSLTLYFPWIRKVIGPMFIVVGIFLLGYLRLKWSLPLLSLPKKYLESGKSGLFLMGFSFSLGFCPTMFVLFFLSLMPVALTKSYGVILPSIFAIGTTLPIFIFTFLLWYFEVGGVLLKQGRKAGLVIQRVAGIFFLVIGLLDTLTYWSI
jgi:cytochrome c biogenesis protein CcdA